jgi:hypothetical protein
VKVGCVISEACVVQGVNNEMANLEKINENFCVKVESALVI